ncbi:MAG: hypothetical protein E7008_00425 [Alphaproteobacteria bacterium]|nr:hypothetical protein [Alphaproteobacteria bacterium]
MKLDKMPELTRANIENLLDVPYRCVLAYDYRTRDINRMSYANYPSGGVFMYADLARAALESVPEFGERKIVLATVQGVPEVSWPGVNQFKKFPLNNEMSTFVMGNVIVFNPKTGLYEANPAGWMGLGMPNVLARNEYMGLQNFLYNLWAREQDRRRFIEPFKTK